jgi:predicted GNAT superfamily acetyltransferase
MSKEFIPYEHALELKELSFDEECGAFYFKDLENIYQKCCEWFVSNDDAYYYGEEILCVAPLYQQAFRWFREKYNLIMHIQRHSNNKYLACMGIQVEILCDTYEEAELACLKKLIEIVKNK